MNPYGENYYDGISLNPFEVMFVKVKGVLLQNDWSYARVAKKYDEWMTMQVPHCVGAHGTPSGPTGQLSPGVLIPAVPRSYWVASVIAGHYGECCSGMTTVTRVSGKNQPCAWLGNTTWAGLAAC